MINITPISQKKYNIGFKGENNRRNVNLGNGFTYSPQENYVIKRNAVIGGLFYGCLGSGLVMLWDQFTQHNKEADIPGTGLKTKDKAIITVLGGLGIAVIGAIVSAIQTKRSINLMHQINNQKNIQNKQYS